jgi:U4/U6.U5 tri-snRNP component SNU23
LFETQDGVTKTGVGWHCKVCDCFLKDSHTYLDHINGKKHQRNLGYSMRVEKSTTDQVKERLAQLKRELEEKNSKSEVETTTDYEDVIKAKDEEVLARKAERARKREQRKKRLQEAEKPEEEEAEEIHPDMAAMMGFAGFGGGNKTA